MQYVCIFRQIFSDKKISSHRKKRTSGALFISYQRSLQRKPLWSPLMDMLDMLCRYAFTRIYSNQSYIFSYQKYKTREYVVAGKAVTDAATGVPCLYNLSDVEHHNHNPLNLKRMGLTSVYGWKTWGEAGHLVKSCQLPL